MSRRAFLGLGLAASAAAPAKATFLWLKSPPTSPYFATVNNATELQTLLDAARSSPSTYAGKIIAIADGDYSGGADGSGARFNATGIVASSEILFYGIGDQTATLPGINWSDVKNDGTSTTASTNLVFTRVSIIRAYDSRVGVILQEGSTNCGILDCELASTAFSTFDLRFKVSVSGGAGSAFTNGDTLHVVNSLQTPYTSGHTAFGTYESFGSTASTICFQITTPSSPNPSPVYNTEIAKWNGKILQNASGTVWRTLANPCNASSPVSGSGANIAVGMQGDCTGMIMDSCDVHDLKWSFAGHIVSGVVQYNFWNNLFTSFFDLEGVSTDTLIQWNQGQHLWSTHFDGAPGTSGGHSSIWGFSVSNIGRCSGVQVLNNQVSRGFARFDHPANMGGGIYAFPSGPEMNDQGAIGTDTFNGCIGGTGGVSSTTLTITAGPGPPPAAQNPKIAAGMSVRFNGGSYSDSVTIVSQTSGPTGGGTVASPGVYTMSAPLTIPDGSAVFITTVNDGWTIRGNLIIGIGDSIGWEFAYTKNSKFLYNTILCDLDLTAAGFLNIHDQYTGNLIAKNIMVGYSPDPADNSETMMSPDLFTASNDNLCALYNATSGPASYFGLFHGKMGTGVASDFQRLTIADAITAFTPKASGRAGDGTYGFTAYVDLVNKTTNYPADPTPVSSNVATGITTNHVHFDGSTYSRWFTSANHNPLLEFSTGVRFTAIFQFRIDAADDDRACFLGAAKNTVYELFRNTDGTITFLVRSDGTTVAASARSNFTVMGADGMTTVMATVDTSTYQIWMTKGNYVDPFLNVTTFTGLPMLRDNGNNNASIGNTYTGTSQEFRGDMGVISINEALVNASTVAGLSKVIAQDNNPVSYGTDGSTLYGSAAKVQINAVAANWNANTQNGGNLATAFIKQAGTYTDAA